MKRFWFRICFEKEFPNKEQAEEFIDTITEGIDTDGVEELTQDMERRNLKKEKKR